MGRNLHAVAAAGALLITISGAGPALAQKSGGVLKIYHRDSPASMSILEEATNWSWNEDGTELTFRLRSGVKWHDGYPFTANDVNGTWDLLLGKSQEKLRANPRKQRASQKPSRPASKASAIRVICGQL